MLSRSIDFLLNNAGCVIQYRLKKEILGTITPDEEEQLLSQIYETENMRLLRTYVKPSGYIGSGMHSWDNWRGEVLHRTPLEDGETACRLLGNYRIPKEHPIVRNLLSVLTDENALEKEFSYIPPEVTRFRQRFVGINNGNCLMTLVYTMRALLGAGDDLKDIIDYQALALKGFERILTIDSISDVTQISENRRQKYNYPLMKTDEYFPNSYTLSLLAHSQSWRSETAISTLSSAINRINEIMTENTNIHVKIENKRFVPYFALVRPYRAFHPDTIDTINYRRPLTEMAMLGAGESIHVLKETKENILNALDQNGVLRMNLKKANNPRYSPKSLLYPTPYTDVRLEENYKQKYALDCDMTFWAVELLHWLEKKGINRL